MGESESGVAIALTPTGMAAWRAAGSVTHKQPGGRVMAVRLRLMDTMKRAVHAHFQVGYAPISTASDKLRQRQEYFAEVKSCMEKAKSGDITIFAATDCNSSTGITTERQKDGEPDKWRKEKQNKQEKNTHHPHALDMVQGQQQSLQ